MATQTKKSAFDKLSAVNVYDKVEKKGQLTYLSWAHAWAFAKKLYPELTRKVYESEFSYAASVKKLLDIFEK